MSPGVLGALLGLLAGAGLVLAVSAAPPLRRASLDDRLAPYLRDTPRPSRLLAAPDTRTPFPTLERLLRPAVARLAERVDEVVGGSTAVTRKLEALGRGQTLSAFRAEQVVWAAGALLLVLALFGLSAVAGDAWNPLTVLALAGTAVVGGVYARDAALDRQLRRREERILAELPTVAELLALAVAAGEGVVGAVERVSRQSSGELAAELSGALAEVRAGTPLVAALQAVSARTRVTELARFLDGMVVAVERGTPLAEVLRAQAVDVREAGKRDLLESAGRREIGMLVPVVFLVLPVTVLFALYPALLTLTAVAR